MRLYRTVGSSILESVMLPTTPTTKRSLWPAVCQSDMAAEPDAESMQASMVNHKAEQPAALPRKHGPTADFT